jgi:hypothetical protein
MDDETHPIWYQEGQEIPPEIAKGLFKQPRLLFTKHAWAHNSVKQAFLNTPEPRYNQTILTQACVKKDEELVRLLIATGLINIELQGQVYSGWPAAGIMTALGCAADKQSLPLVKILCEEGHANLNTTMGMGWTALQHATSNWDAKMVRYLLQ